MLVQVYIGKSIPGVGFSNAKFHQTSFIHLPISTTMKDFTASNVEVVWALLPAVLGSVLGWMHSHARFRAF